MAVLASPKPVPRLIAYTLGVGVVATAFGVIALLLIEAAGGTAGTSNASSGHNPLGSDIVHTVIGALLIGFGLYLFVHKPGNSGKGNGLFNKLTGPQVPIKDFAIAGVTMMSINVTTFVFYLAILHNIARARVDFADQVLMLAITIFCCMLPATIPLAVAIFGGKAAREKIHAFGQWMVKYSRVILGTLLVAFGLQDLIVGIGALLHH